VIDVIHGAYKSPYDGAYQCLRDYQVNRLPVDLLKITRSAGIKVIKNSDTHVLNAGKEHGASFFIGGNWYLVYDDTQLRSMRRESVAHELGHIFLGHEIRGEGYIVRQQRDEEAADVFAVDLLAPEFVLWTLGIRDSLNISGVCDINIPFANIRAAQLAERYAARNYSESPIEKKIHILFFDYIEKSLAEREGY